MNLTGGLSWHWLAWRSQARWAPTCKAIEDWLLANASPTQSQDSKAAPSLLLIGASAGWMMSSQWLQQFARVDTYDIDPWAAFLFNWRHGKALNAAGTDLYCHKRDALQDLPGLLSAHPKSCVFFVGGFLGVFFWVQTSPKPKTFFLGPEGSSFCCLMFRLCV
jgi:hypothetical protein